MLRILLFGICVGVLRPELAAQYGIRVDTTHPDSIVVISGQVVDGDSQEPLPFASVYIPDSAAGYRIGIATDFDGYFILHLPEGIGRQGILRVSYIGYLVKNTDLKNTEGLSIEMKENRHVTYCCLGCPPHKLKRMMDSPSSITILDREDLERWVW